MSECGLQVRQPLTQRVLCQVLRATRGDCTLHHEYSFRPAAASLHLGTYTSASFIGRPLHTHYYLPFLAMVTAAVTTYHLAPPYVLTVREVPLTLLGLGTLDTCNFSQVTVHDQSNPVLPPKGDVIPAESAGPCNLLLQWRRVVVLQGGFRNTVHAGV